ncbi:Phosphoribosylformimino-5-aminoimidazole carboxamide ribotide isomerase [Irpex lacteus]|nr:Phosphoribosylformimino-5-aminoimidazole carboxamide ribotide isomerase [Irpex lacteus]
MPHRTLFRPCIDLHEGQVKQIVGGTLSDGTNEDLKTNFVATKPPKYYAELYKNNGLTGGHVIMLGKGNVEAAKEALAAWPGGLQVGGGINDENCLEWIEYGASKVIVTSYLFPDAKFSLERLEKISSQVGKDKLVVDVSCRRRGDKWFVAMDKWQRITEMEVCKESLDLLSRYCDEFLIHAADVEGLCKGIDEDLVRKLGEWVTIPTTYAGGAKSVTDLQLVDDLSGGKVDLTFGSALDIFGGSLVSFDELVVYNSVAKKTGNLPS